MNNLMIILFILSVIILVYPYLIYPLSLALLPIKKIKYSIQHYKHWPIISIIIPVFNGEKVIKSKIDNLFSLDYPGDKMEIIIVSDNSNDNTINLLNEYFDQRLKILDQKVRKGKTAAENSALEICKGEYLVFTDAAVHLEYNSLKALVNLLQDKRVGTVSTVDKIVSGGNNTVSEGENAYVHLEMWIRAKESNFGLLVGASGSCYACRRELGIKIPSKTTRDFYTPLLARKRGFINVIAPDAFCYIGAQGEVKNEFIRKVRTINNGIVTLACHWSLLNLFRYGLFSWVIASHKIFRWLGLITMAGILLANMYLANFGIWGILLILQVFIYMFSVCSILLGKEVRFKLLKMINFFMITNVAAFIAVLDFVRNKDHVIWNPTNR